MNPEVSSIIKDAMSEAVRQHEVRTQVFEERLSTEFLKKTYADPTFRKKAVADLGSAVQEVAKPISSELNIPYSDMIPTIESVRRDLESSVLPGLQVEQVSNLVLNTLKNIDRAYERNLQLATWVFITAVAMIITAVIAAIFMQNNNVTVVVFGGGGLVGLFATVMVNRPIEQVTAGASSLVKLNMIYTSYYSQLAMFGKLVNKVTGTDESKEISQQLLQMTREMVIQLEKENVAISTEQTSQKRP